MSASRDKGQKFTFVYPNFYQIKPKARNEGAVEPVESSPTLERESSVPETNTANVLKTGDLHEPAFASWKVREYSPAEIISKRVQRQSVAAVSPVPPASNETIRSLKQNLKSLSDLHSRLRFMLLELEELIKE